MHSKFIRDHNVTLRYVLIIELLRMCGIGSSSNSLGIKISSFLLRIRYLKMSVRKVGYTMGMYKIQSKQQGSETNRIDIEQIMYRS